MSYCVGLSAASYDDPSVLPVLSANRPLRVGDKLDFYVSFEHFLDANEQEEVLTREWSVNGPVVIESYSYIPELTAIYQGKEYTYLSNEKVILSAPEDAVEGPSQVFIKVTTDLGRTVTFAFIVNITDWPDLPE